MHVSGGIYCGLSLCTGRKFEVTLSSIFTRPKPWPVFQNHEHCHSFKTIQLNLDQSKNMFSINILFPNFKGKFKCLFPGESCMSSFFSECERFHACLMSFIYS